jgi:hypothetical protein
VQNAKTNEQTTPKQDGVFLPQKGGKMLHKAGNQRRYRSTRKGWRFVIGARISPLRIKTEAQSDGADRLTPPFIDLNEFYLMLARAGQAPDFPFARVSWSDFPGQDNRLLLLADAQIKLIK